MTQSLFLEIMEEFGCHAAGGIAFGTRAGYPFSAEMERNRPPLLYVFRFIVTGDTKPVVEALKSGDIPHIRWRAEPDDAGGALVGLLRPPSEFYFKAEARELLAAAAKALKAAGQKAPDTCPLCGRGNCDRTAWLNGGNRRTHHVCLDNRLDLPEEDTVTPDRVRGNPFTGLLGALLGALIGALPNWAQAIGSGKVHAILYALIPLLSALLYRLFRGRATRAFSSLSVLLSSLAVAFFMELFWYWLVVSDSFSIHIPFSQAIQAYFTGHSFILTVQEMLLSLVFLLAGYFAATVLLRRYANSGTEKGRTVRGKRFVLASARPLPFAGDDNTPEDNTLPHGGQPYEQRSESSPS